jgi:hypothetical protein
VSPNLNTERDRAIAAAARLGQSHDSLAAEHHLTRQRISQIIATQNPRSPEEAQRQLIAARLRSRWDELEKIVARPPIKTTSIGRTQWDPRTCTCGVKGDTKREHDADCPVQPVLDMAAVTAAIKTQLAVEAQYPQMFGVDLATRPGPAFDEAALLKLAEIRVAQRQLAAQAPVTLPALPPDYATLPPAQQARADLERRGAALQAQRAAIQRQAEDDDIPEAEIVDE